MSDDICERLVRFSKHKQCMSTDLEVEAADEITRLREENARLLKENSELILRAHALLWLLPPEITCGELRKARDEMFAATIREGGKG